MEEIEYFIDVGYKTLDLRDVIAVSYVFGDEMWRSYSVYLYGNVTFDFYHKRQEDNYTTVPREEFVRRWKLSKK